MNLTNRTILISGANRGIGKALVETLLTRDVKKIYACARDINSLPNFNDHRIVPLTLDITNQEQIEQATQSANDIDLLINNAGVAAFSSLLDGSIELIQRDMNTNFYGTLAMVRAFTPILENSRNSSIINIVTIAAFTNFPALGGYCASKAALFSLSQGIRVELHKKEISVHTVNPGPIDTDMAKDMPMDKTSPEVTAENIVSSLEAGEVDIFPDEGSQTMIDIWKKDYRQLESLVLDMQN